MSLKVVGRNLPLLYCRQLSLEDMGARTTATFGGCAVSTSYAHTAAIGSGQLWRRAGSACEGSHITARLTTSSSHHSGGWQRPLEETGWLWLVLPTTFPQRTGDVPSGIHELHLLLVPLRGWFHRAPGQCPVATVGGPSAASPPTIPPLGLQYRKIATDPRLSPPPTELAGYVRGFIPAASTYGGFQPGLDHISQSHPLRRSQPLAQGILIPEPTCSSVVNVVQVAPSSSTCTRIGHSNPNRSIEAASSPKSPTSTRSYSSGILISVSTASTRSESAATAHSWSHTSSSPTRCGTHTI